MIKKLNVPGEIFEWIDICQPAQGELEAFARERDLHPYTVRDCLEPDHLPKFELLSGGVRFLIFRRYSLREDEPNPMTIQEMTTKVAIFYNERMLVTIHRKPTDFLETLHKNYVESGRSDEVREVVTKILWYTLNSFERPAEQMTDKIDEIENTIFLKHAPPDIEQNLYFLKRRASVVRHVLDQTGELMRHLETSPDDSPSLHDARDLHTKLVTTYAQIRDDVGTLLNTHLALSSQRTNDVMKILTIFSAFFLPLTFVAGIYGMNFDLMPELRHPLGYFLTLAAMLLIAIVIYLWFKRKKWL